MSTRTGPGRPVRATWKASCSVRASRSVSLTSQLALVQARVMPTVSASDHEGRDLPGQHDDGDRVHQRVGEARHRVRRAGTGGDERDADAAGRAGVALGRMDRALLVPDEDVADVVLLEQLVVDREDGAAGIAEHGVDALVLERLDHHPGARHLAGRGLRAAVHLSRSFRA